MTLDQYIRNATNLGIKPLYRAWLIDALRRDGYRVVKLERQRVKVAGGEHVEDVITEELT